MEITLENISVHEATKFDEEGVLHGCLVCGIHSENGHDYTTESFEEALDAKLYENAGVFLDHPNIIGGEPVDRDCTERLGTLKNARLSPEGLRADYHAITSHPMYNIIKEDFEKGLGGFSFSHVAKTESDENGKKITKITRVYEVDICTTPNGTTTTLLESKMADEKDVNEADVLKHNALMLSLESVIKDDTLEPEDKKQKIMEHLDHHFSVNEPEEKDVVKKETLIQKYTDGELVLEKLQHQVEELEKITEMQRKYFVSPMSAPPVEMIQDDHLTNLRKIYNS